MHQGAFLDSLKGSILHLISYEIEGGMCREFICLIRASF